MSLIWREENTLGLTLHHRVAPRILTSARSQNLTDPTIRYGTFWRANTLSNSRDSA